MDKAEQRLQQAERALEARLLTQARDDFDCAERLGADPDRCSGGRWTAAMLAGDFELAWLQSDALRLRGNPDAHRFWTGESPLGKRVIVRCLRGFGDAVQMLRLLPRLRQLASRVMIEVAPDFVPLAHCLNGADEVLTWGQDAPAKGPEWDVQVELMELPYLLRISPGDLPPALEYVRLPLREVEAARGSMGTTLRPRVGIVSTASDWDVRRSVTVAQLEPLITMDEVELWCMDRTYGLRGDSRLRNVRDEVGDGLLPLAAAIANLDLVITVDTLAAHLAGAMGKPVWLMLQHAADWRWMIERDDSAWYPSMRLFRQQRPGKWDDVVRILRKELAAFSKAAVLGEATQTVYSGAGA